MIIKICGFKETSHAMWAAEQGANLLGFVFAKSARRVTPEQAKEIISQLPGNVKKIGVFVNEDLDVVNSIIEYCGLDLVQLHGEESPEYCRQSAVPVIKAFRVKDRESLVNLKDYHGVVEMLLLDTFVGGMVGGSGQTFDWSLARDAAEHGKIILAGGLTPENVASAMRTAKPFGVDVSSGVETGGGKDVAKITAFIRNARGG